MTYFESGKSLSFGQRFLKSESICTDYADNDSACAGHCRNDVLRSLSSKPSHKTIETNAPRLNYGKDGPAHPTWSNVAPIDLEKPMRILAGWDNESEAELLLTFLGVEYEVEIAQSAEEFRAAIEPVGNTTCF